MLRVSIHKLHDLKVFSQNHKKHELTLRSFSKKTSTEYKVRLSKEELEKVIAFIEDNMFKDN